MKLAIPVTNGQVSPHFGHCEQFALFVIDDSTKKVSSKEMLVPPPHEPGLLPAWLGKQDVTMIITGGMGSRAQGLFQQNNIEVIMGVAEDDPDKVVQDYLEGTLSSGSNICDH